MHKSGVTTNEKFRNIVDLTKPATCIPILHIYVFSILGVTLHLFLRYFHIFVTMHFASPINAKLPKAGFYFKKSLITTTCNYSSTFKSNRKKTERGGKYPLIFNLFAQGVALPWKDGR